MINQEETNFRWRDKKNNKRSSWCKKCHSEYESGKWKNSIERRFKKTETQKNRTLRNEKFIWDILSSSKCMDCGNDNPVVLEFDHLDPNVKFKNISDMKSQAYSIKTIQKEIDKCDVVCANCHRIRTAKQFNYYYKISNPPV